MIPDPAPSRHSPPLIGIDITGRDDCFRGIRIAIRARQQEIGTCRLCYIESRPDPAGGQLAQTRLASCDGVIAFAPSNEHEEALSQLSVPVINVSARLHDSRFQRVLTDHRAMGRLAAESLINRGLRQLITWEAPLAYIHWRSQGIQDAVDASDGTLHRVARLTDLGLDLLPDIPPPIGIIGSNDHQARKVIEALRAKDWAVPGQVAVIGMDNDSQICETCEVPITSVGIDTLRWGATALDTMLAMIEGRQPEQDIIWIPPLGVVERDSTAHDDSAGSIGTIVLSLLKQERSLRWNAQDLALRLGVSRATLVRHCRDTLGATPHQLLHQARLRHAENLLRKSTHSIAGIAARCGWRSSTRMVIAFRTAHGMTPSAYRRLQRNRTPL